MPRRKRKDDPGEWFHVMNRAIARRTMFERGADIDLFLERIGQTVERGWLEVHAYSVLTTHFHFLVRSPSAEMSRALHHIELGYVRHFNRTRRRDGPLVRGRFKSKVVGSLAYRRTLVGYIDANAVQARIVSDATDYPFCSCRDYVVGPGPEWLSRDWVESEVCGAMGVANYDGSLYSRVFRRGFPAPLRRMIARRIENASDEQDPVDSLLRGAAPAVLQWVRRKAALADGTRPGLPLVPIPNVARIMAAAGPFPPPAVHRSERTDWRLAAHALLLRNLAGLTFAEIGTILHRSAEATRRLVIRASRALQQESAFAVKVAECGYRTVAETYGGSVVV